MRSNDGWEAKRNVSGVVLLDKPVGVSSNKALQTVKRLFNARKAGHTGSLDPLATGMLPICLGEATKFSGFLLTADKSYRFVCRLGMTTSTGDSEGKVLRVRSSGGLGRAVVEAVLERFVGAIYQTPPMYSALKHSGKRLYELARQGMEVERQPRKVNIHALTLLNFEKDHLECQMRCSKGTYVRTLVEDLGEALGCGAHIVALRRTDVEPYSSAQMISMKALQERAEDSFEAVDALLLPVDSAIAGWPAVRVLGNSTYYLKMGQPVSVSCFPAQGWVRLYEGNEGRFLGIGEILEDGRVAPRRLIRTD